MSAVTNKRVARVTPSIENSTCFVIPSRCPKRIYFSIDLDLNIFDLKTRKSTKVDISSIEELHEDSYVSTLSLNDSASKMYMAVNSHDYEDKETTIYQILIEDQKAIVFSSVKRRKE